MISACWMLTLLSGCKFNELLSSCRQLGDVTSPPFPGLWKTKFINKIFYQQISTEIFLSEFSREMFPNIFIPKHFGRNFFFKIYLPELMKIYWYLLFDNLTNLRREDFHLKHSFVYLHLFSMNASIIEGNRHLPTTSVKLLQSENLNHKR